MRLPTQKTHSFSIVKLCRFLDEKSEVSRTSGNQLLRSGTSIGANIEEGRAAQSEADFISKYSIACKEARETYDWLRLLTASDILQSDRITEMEKECHELVPILTSIIKKMKSKRQ